MAFDLKTYLSQATHAYIARKKCGCVPAITVDHPDHAKDNAKTVASWIRDGYSVERVTIEDGRTMLHFCHCDDQPETPSLFGEANNATA